MSPRSLDSIPESVKEVYARFGLAMYLCQCVERQLATLLATKYGPGVSNLTQGQYDELLRTLFRKTLGGLIKRLRKSAVISDNIENDLEKVLKHRNWLAHNYFWERAGHFTEESGCLFMSQELEELVRFLDQFETQISALLSEWVMENGVSEEMIEAEMTKLPEDAINGL